MLSLPAALIAEKNKITTTYPWFIVVDVILAGGTTLRIVNNTDDITFSGNVYTAFPFQLSAYDEQQSGGQLPRIILQVSNVTRVFQAYMEDIANQLNSTATIRLINYNNLAADYADLTLTYSILSANSDADWMAFILGAPNLLKKRFPRFKYLANHCMWVKNFTTGTWQINKHYSVGDICLYNNVQYVCTSAHISVSTPNLDNSHWHTGSFVGSKRNIECKYVGTSTSCKGTLDDCILKKNSIEFGGFPGLAHVRIRVV